ncbi:helix-turn-helix transcriptional regulator [Lentzea tibetensis]|uniref:Helix-turn-helix transcriptional regulator n=1 Tax=Lentzea tibetensis TaxID=2591470 RepID=A0A563ERH8_9PSEU|nr:helix-turn-helix domain-containing protein [Lentzea tibetensis]TWP50115.1 helix-turn-helix transcriptional regulator [Lentzea tibetensis]
MEHVTSRWGVLVLHALRSETLRYGRLRRKIIGVSEKMLTQTLQTLERDGLVHREVFPVIPPHVEYSLTPLGEGAAARVAALFAWIEDHTSDVVAAQDRYDDRKVS